MSDQELGIGLAEAVTTVRRELLRAQLSAEREHMPFEVGQVEIEFAVDVVRQRDGKFGLNVWAVEAGLERSDVRRSSHRLTVVLQPWTRDGGTPSVASRHADDPLM